MTLIARHRLDGPDAWWGQELARSTRWTWHLSPQHEREVDLALDAVIDAGWCIGEIPKTRRALPKDHEVLWRNTHAGALRGGIAQTPRRSAQ